MLPTSTRTFVCAEPVDMRRSFAGLARCTREVCSRTRHAVRSPAKSLDVAPLCPRFSPAT
jgi:hypothetical protein